MASTNWTNNSTNNTNWNSDQYIANLGATMASTSYTMADTVLTMGDFIQNPLFGASTNYTVSSINSTDWSGGTTPSSSGNAYGLLLGITQ